MRLGSGRRAAALVRAQTAPQHKGCGFEGLRFSCRLKGVFVHVNIDFCCCFCVWFGLVLAFFFFVFLVTGLWIYQLNHWMGFTSDCRDGGVPGSPSHAGNAMTVPGVRTSWACTPDPSLCGANALLRLNPRILSRHEIGWWSIFSAVYFDIEFVIQGLNTVNSCLTAGCYCLPGWLLATGAGLSGEGCTAKKGGPGTSIRCFCQEDQGRCSYKILEASKLVVVEGRGYACLLPC